MAHGTEAPAKDARQATASPNCHRLFSLPQAVDHARVPIETILDGISVGELQAYCVHGGQIRIDEVELDQFLAFAAARQP